MDDAGPRIAVNGFGRIGRLVTRILLSADVPVDFVAVNDPTDKKILAHLFRHDSVHGAYPGTVEVSDDGLVLDGDRLVVLAQKAPGELPWLDLRPDLVIEATGLFRDKAGIQQHFEAGAPRVLLTAPGEADAMIVRGVNDDAYDPSRHRSVSAASCTTNCLAPVLKVLDEAFGVERALMTTVHAVTNDQRLLDATHSDPRRARSALLSMIPTKTGAARAIGKVLPHLAGKVDGQSIRVPTADVSLVDLVAELATAASVDDAGRAFRRAEAGPLTGILGCEDEPLVSVDYIGDARSAIVDVPALQTAGSLVKVLAWYDNEWAYAHRVVELAQRMVGAD